MKYLLFALLGCCCSSFAAEQTPASKPLIGLYGGGHNSTLPQATECGVTIFYPSVSWENPPEWLTTMTAAAHERGISVYPSLASAYDADEGKLNKFASAHPEFLEKRRDGTLLNSGDTMSMSWVHPEVRAYKVQRFTELVKKTGVDGVLLDYTRFLGNDSGYSQAFVDAFKKKHGRDPMKIPNDDPQWVRFRADFVTLFIRELRDSLKTVRPGLKLIACVNPDPAKCLQISLQDWATWLDEGLIDGVTTMIYERDTNNTIVNVQTASKAIRGRVPLIAMICPEYDNLPTPELLRQGSLKSLQAGADGVGYYHEGSVFRLKLWDTIKEVAGWKLQDVRAQPVDYVLNGSFENALDSWAVGTGSGIALADEGRTGAHALKFDLSKNANARQIIDRGFISQGNAVELTGWAKHEQAGPAKMEVEITIAYSKSPERRFRVPIELGSDTQWQQFSASVDLGNLADLKFVIVALCPNGEGECLVDDVSVNITAKPVDSKQWVVAKAQPEKPAAETNIARGQLVMGSSFWENGFEYFLAVDGNLSSDNYGKGAAWHSQRPALNQWIKIYLPETYLVTRIRLLNSSAQSAYRTKDFKIEISTDDITYREVKKGTMPDDGETWVEIKIPPTPAKYVRFTGLTGFNLEYAVGLKEIELY